MLRAFALVLLLVPLLPIASGSSDVCQNTMSIGVGRLERTCVSCESPTRMDQVMIRTDGAIFYVEVRNDKQPILGNYVYEETNRFYDLQRGGTDLTGLLPERPECVDSPTFPDTMILNGL